MTEMTEYPYNPDATVAEVIQQAAEQEFGADTSAVAVADKPMKKRGRPAKYNWDQLLNGEEHRIQTTDLPVTAENFRSLVHTTARRRGVKATTKITDGTFVLRANGPVSD